MIVRMMQRVLDGGFNIFYRHANRLAHLKSLSYYAADNTWDALFEDIVAEGYFEIAFGEDADADWKLVKTDDASWELNTSVNEGRRARQQEEPFGLKSQLMISILQKRLAAGDGVDVHINFFGRGISGVLQGVKVNSAGTLVTLNADVGEGAQTVLTLDDKEVQSLQLVRQNDGRFKLTGESRYPSWVNEAYSGTQEVPLFVSMLKRLLDAGKLVYVSYIRSGEEHYAQVLSADVDNLEQGLEVTVRYSDGREGAYLYTHTALENVTLIRNGIAWLIQRI